MRIIKILLYMLVITPLTMANAAPAPPINLVATSSEPGTTPDPAETTSISQHGITWTFSSAIQYGQFANGDYYVIDPGTGIRINNINPAYSISGSRALNGSMLNPAADGSTQGYDGGSAYFPYNAGLNVAIGVSPSIPLTISAGDTLISSISENPYPGNNVSYLKTAAVLTCLSAVPPAGSFRPGYCDRAQTLYNTANLNYSLLGSLERPSSAPLLANVERTFQRVWLDHLPRWGARFLHPNDNMSNYGRELSNDVSIGALMLHLNYSNAEKERLMIYFVQLGIDLYSIVKAGARDNWQADGGHASGRKWPILFAGLVLGDSDMRNIGQKSGDYINSGSTDYLHFGEDDQTFYVTQNSVDLTNSSSWNPDTRAGTPAPYTSAMIGMPEWGIRNAYLPQNSDAAWHAIYRQCCTTFAWTGFVLSARIMNAQSLWNHDVLFYYQDRYMAITNGTSDPLGFSVPGEVAGWRVWGRSSVLNYNEDFQADMWDTFR